MLHPYVFVVSGAPNLEPCDQNRPAPAMVEVPTRGLFKFKAGVFKTLLGLETGSARTAGT